MKIQKEEIVLVPIRKTAHCEKCGVERQGASADKKCDMGG